MKKRVMLILSCLFLSIGFILAQTTTISGTVVDNNGESVIGASVVVKGTTIGVATDLDGKFSIEVPDGKNVLVFSLVGMKTAEVKAVPNMRVVMEENMTVLDDIIVVAYGTSTKDSFTGSAGVLSSKEIGKLQVSNLSQALEGSVPGLQVAAAGGQPGSSGTLRIRGYGSLAAGNDPLIVVDGAVFDGSLNSINSQDVESMTVLKDAASAALYGSRAANGVIIVTTKKGKAGKTQVSLEVRQGINVRGTSLYDTYSDPGEYLKTYWQALYNDALYEPDIKSKNPDPGVYASNQLFVNLAGYNPYVGVKNNEVISTSGVLASNLKRRYNDDWEDALLRTAYRQEYNVSISGGTDKLSSYLSLGYLNDEGIVRGTGFDRFSIRANNSYELFKGLKINANLAYSRTNQEQIKAATNATAASNTFYTLNTVPPIYPVYMYDLDGNRMLDSNGNSLYDYADGQMPGVTGARKYAANQNAVAAAKDDKNSVITDNFISRSGIEYSFLDGFRFAATLGYDVRNNNTTVFYNSVYGDAQGRGRVRRSASRFTTTTANQILNYNKTINSVHNLSALLGHETYQYKRKYLYGEKMDFVLDNLAELSNAQTMSEMTSYGNKKTVESYFSQLLYDFDNRYYFSASFRRDGSSIFHKDNRWGNFWSVGGSWRISQEEFMKDISWLDNLRFRISYGTSGNDNILDEDGYVNYLPYKTQYSVNPIGLGFEYKGNENLKWEKNDNFNIGLDLGLMDNRLKLEFDFYVRKASDLLYNRPIPISEGYSYMPENIGDMKNTGIEFNLSYDIIRNADFRWNVSLTGSHNKNKITKLPMDNIVKGYRILRVGGTMYDHYLLDYAGVDVESGKALYRLEDGSTTTSASTAIDSEGRIVAGTALPDFMGGFNMSFDYKGFDLSIMTNFQIGGKIRDVQYTNLMHGGSASGNWHKDIQKAWTPENTNTSVPRLGTKYQDANFAQSTRFLIGADFFSLRNITLGYTLPKKVLNQLKVNNLRVYVTGDNIALFSQRKGLDPRQALSSGVTGRSNVSGTSDYNYTPVSAYSIGLSLNF